MIARRRDPDACGHGQASLLRFRERERLLERLPQTLGDQLGSFGLRELVGDHDELVSPEAPKRVDVAYDVIESLRRPTAGAHRRRRG